MMKRVSRARIRPIQMELGLSMILVSRGFSVGKFKREHDSLEPKKLLTEGAALESPLTLRSSRASRRDRS